VAEIDKNLERCFATNQVFVNTPLRQAFGEEGAT